MNFIHAFILGIIEGITEFLPISSTAHLILTSNFLEIKQTDFQKFFEVFIQSGSMFSVIFLYFQYVKKNKNIIKKILFSFLPTAIIGFVLYKIIKKVFFESNLLIITAMIFFGVIFLMIESLIKTKKIKLKKTVEKLSIKEAVIVGLSQAIAVIPGVSRSGIVMATMMILGYRRDQSAVYSFLLAVPTIFAASFLDMIKMKDMFFSISQDNLLYLIIGFFTSFISAYLSVKWLIYFLQKKSLTIFGWYRILLGIILLMI